MSTSPSFFFRSHSPGFTLPKSHMELMDTYKSWTSFSPKIKSRTYKRDAAGLVVSWLKSIVKKKLWRWRLNCGISKRPRVDLSIKSKKPPVFIERRVFLQKTKDSNYINRRIRQPGTLGSRPSEAPKTDRAHYSSSLSRRAFLLPTPCEISKSKLDSARKISAFIIYRITKTYIDTFLIMLQQTRSYWVGKKTQKLLLNILKTHLKDLFSQLKSKTIMTSLALYKIFAQKTERNIAHESSLHLSPKSRNQETTARYSEFSKTIPFECSPEVISNCNSSSIRSESSILEFNGKSKVFKSTSKEQIIDLLEANFNSIRKIVRASHGKRQNFEGRRGLEIRGKLQGMVRSLAQGLKSALGRVLRVWRRETSRMMKIRRGLKGIEKAVKNCKRSRLVVGLARVIAAADRKRVGLKSHRILMKCCNSRKAEVLGRFKKIERCYYCIEKVLKIFRAHMRTNRQRGYSKLVNGLRNQMMMIRYETVGDNALRLFAYILKVKVEMYQRSAFESIKNVNELARFKAGQKIGRMIATIAAAVGVERTKNFGFAFEALKINVKNMRSFEKNYKTAEIHRKKCLCSKGFMLWKGLKEDNKKLSRAFEILGRLFYSKKSEIFGAVHLVGQLVETQDLTDSKH